MIFGLVVDSDFALPELLPIPKPAWESAETDFVISQDALDWSSPTNPPLIDDFMRGRPQELWLNVPGKLTMRITHGNSIAYHPHPGVEPAELRAFLLGSGLGAVLAQRGLLVLHGNALAMPDGSALICVGDSGAGKSTTAAALMLRGYQVLADDVCPIMSDGMVHPGLARTKLWDDTTKKLGIATKGLERLPGDPAKWSVPLDRSARLTPSKPQLIVQLDPDDSEDITATRLSGAAKFTALRNNIFRPVFNRALNNEVDCLKRVADMCEAVEIIRVSRPHNKATIPALVDKILELHAFYRGNEGAMSEPVAHSRGE